MSSLPLALWLFWVAAAAVAAGLLAAVATRRLNPLGILTAREWKTAAQLVGIFLLTLVIIYFINAHRYDAKDFIYGRF